MQKPDPSVIRIALVDEQTLFREGLQALNDFEPDLEVVAVAATVQELEALEVEPQIVITGLAFAEVPPDVVIKRIRLRFPGAAVVALTVRDDLPTIRQALAAGADGYISKSTSKADLFACIRAVAGGGLYLQPSIGIAFAPGRPTRSRRARSAA